MYYPPSYHRHFLLQTSIFVFYFYNGVNFYGNKIAVILFCGNLFLWELIFVDREKNTKIAKIRTRKNIVPHGSFLSKETT